MITTQAVLARVKSLPTLSATVAHLSKLVSDERAGASDFESVIRPDPSLTANLLRFANSAYFGLRSRAETVRQAVTVLGVKRVFEVATFAAMGRVIPPVIPGYGLDAGGFWRHCIAVAVLAEGLARCLGGRPPDLTFTAGLLHDAGKLAIGVYVDEQAQPILGWVKDGLTFVGAERAVLGIDHAQVGAAVAESWSLPAAVAAAARYHHMPGQAPPGPDSRIVDLVHAADAMAHALGFGADAGGLAREVDGAARERLGAPAARLEQVASESLDAINEMTAMVLEAQPAARAAQPHGGGR